MIIEHRIVRHPHFLFAVAVRIDGNLAVRRDAVHAGRTIVARIGVGLRIMRQAQKKTAVNARDFFEFAAAQSKTVELPRFATGIGAAVGPPGNGFRMVEHEADIAQHQAVNVSGHVEFPLIGGLIVWWQLCGGSCVLTTRAV